MLCYKLISFRLVNTAKYPLRNFAERKSRGFWKNEENIENFIQTLQGNLNLRTVDDWNSLTKKQILSNGGSGLLNQLSIYEIKCKGNKEGKNKYQKPKNHWENKENINNFFKEIEDKLSLTNEKDWDKITKKEIIKLGGKNLLEKYSLHHLKQLKYPSGKFKIKKKNKPSGYWDKEENIKEFLVQLKNQFNLNNFEDWNSISQKQIIECNGSGLLKKLSLNEIKIQGFSEEKSKFELEKEKLFQNNIQKFIEKLQKNLNLKTEYDWNKITINDVKQNNGNFLLNIYSIQEIKNLGFPKGNFNNKNKSYGYWNKQDNIKKFLLNVGLKLNYKSPEDWNLLTQKDIINFGGIRLLSNYSLFDLKCLVCPEGKLIFNSSTEKKSLHYWYDFKNIENFIFLLIKVFNLHSSNDWDRISKSQIYSLGGRGLFDLISKDNHLKEKIILQFPNFSILCNNKSNSFYRSSQRWLFLQLQKLFPGEEIIEDYFHPEISRKSGYHVQFDVFLVNKKIAFEYNGIQHYEDIPSAFAAIEMFQYRDNEKEILCSDFGIKLIVIPYWWDNKIDSLQKTINQKIST